MTTIPFVIEKRNDGERAYDIYSRLLEDRIIFIGDPISADCANNIIAQLLLLDQKDPSLDIYIYINSPGGEVTSGLAIYDTMQLVKADIRTVCVGMAASMAAIILAGGTPGKRSALPNSKVMIHQPRKTGSSETMTVTEQEIDLKLIRGMKLQLSKILSTHTKKPIKKIIKDSELDKWFSASEALEYGLIDEILTTKK